MSNAALKPADSTLSLPKILLESPAFQIERLRRVTRDNLDERLKKHKTTAREYWVLSCLIGHEALSQSALCEMLGFDASDMVRLVDNLEKHKWAKRERDPKDRRRHIVTATKKGQKAHSELTDLVEDAESRALQSSTGKQLKHLRRLAFAILEPED